MAEPPRSEQHMTPDGQVESLRETLRLASELAEAMVTQSNRAKRQFTLLDHRPLAENQIDRLVSHAARLRRHCTEVMGELDTIDTHPRTQPRANPREAAPDGAAIRPRSERRFNGNEVLGRDRAVAAAVQTVAIDLKIMGHSRQQVEETLEQTFGVEDAAEIVEEVFSSTPS